MAPEAEQKNAELVHGVCDILELINGVKTDSTKRRYIIQMLSKKPVTSHAAVRDYILYGIQWQFRHGNARVINSDDFYPAEEALRDTARKLSLLVYTREDLNRVLRDKYEQGRRDGRDAAFDEMPTPEQKEGSILSLTKMILERDRIIMQLESEIKSLKEDTKKVAICQEKQHPPPPLESQKSQQCNDTQSISSLLTGGLSSGLIRAVQNTKARATAVKIRM